MPDFVKISDSIDSDSSVVAASSKAVNTVANAVLEAVKNASGGNTEGSIDIFEPVLGTIQHEMGSWWISLDNSIPTGGLPHLGHLCQRSTYGDFWPWCEANKIVVTEEEWQNYANEHNGCCPYYSFGDGSTTFRTPKYDQSFLKIVAGLSNAGDYQSAGLPNIAGSLSSQDNSDNASVDAEFYSSGAITTSQGQGYGSQVVDAVWNVWKGFSIDASLSNPIYGNSDTVTPQNFGIIVGVYAVSAVSSPIGTTDAASLLNAVSGLESTKASVDLSNLNANGKAFAAGASMPSGRMVELAVGANGAQYTAPADGWFYVTSASGSASGFICIYGQTGDTATSNAGRYDLSAGVPCCKGNTILIYYNSGADINVKFVYAEGAN